MEIQVTKTKEVEEVHNNDMEDKDADYSSSEQNF